MLLISVRQGLQLIAKLSLVLLTWVLPALFLALIDPVDRPRSVRAMGSSPGLAAARAALPARLPLPGVFYQTAVSGTPAVI